MTLLKGALVAFTPTFLPVPSPNVTVFQFNPETLTHKWSQPGPSAGGGGGGAGACGRPGTTTGNPQAVPGMPEEEFSLSVMLDSNEDIIDGRASGALAKVSGVYARLAAMEMLLYPTGGKAMSNLLGQVSSALGFGSSKPGGVTRKVPESTVPVTLFVWGMYRIVPVRVTGLTITETLYDHLLNPIHAEAKLDLRVLTPNELAAAIDTQVLARLGTVAYTYTLGAREAAAAANLANAAQTIGILPK